MKCIVLTPEYSLHNEPLLISKMIEAGVYRVHVRKPAMSLSRLRDYLLKIPADMYQRLSLHDHHRLAVDMNIGGIHLNSRNPKPLEGFTGTISRSTHTLAELRDNTTACDYLFLSPIYDSISKAGYNSNFDYNTLVEAHNQSIITYKTIALGGIKPQHLDQLQDLGFGGAAFLGYVWNSDSPIARINTILSCNK